MSVRTPATRRMPARRLVAGVLSLLLGLGLTARRTHQTVVALRERGARVEPLAHDLALSGTSGHAPTPATAEPRRVVVLGDSAAAGHGLGDPERGLARRVGRALHAADGQATEVHSVAKDGATTAQVLATQVDAAVGASLVLVGVGVNDAVRARSGRRVRGELTALLGAVRHAAPQAQVVLIGCPDLSAAPGIPRVLRAPLGWRCRIVARAQAEVARHLDVAVLWLPRSLLTPEVFGPDGFHPGAVGHERMAAGVLALLGHDER